ncbi:hypothetical protein E8E15_004334 [Penicillium rubens]|nr:hypothetical protein E8E15_004334 [Penicillium rubens]
MESAQIPGGTPAPYGSACMNCSRAKCKCIIPATGTGCERCQRLSKECRPAQTVRKRNKPKSSSNTAHLEAKIDWIMSAFENGGAAPSLPPDWQPVNLGQSQRHDPRQSASITQTPTSVSSSNAEEGQYPAQFLPSYDRDILGLVYVRPAMAQKYLDQFRTRNLQYLPFVYIPSNVTSDQLREKYPFLWRVMLDIAPSMDLLLGIMTFISCAALAMSRIDAMRWTAHMEESLSVLTEAKECPEDELLIALVKIHLVLDRFYQLRRDGEAFMPLPFYLDSFKNQLDTVKSHIPPHLQQHRVLLMYLYNAEIVINELSIGAPAMPHSPDLHRLDSLYTSLRATKGWLDVWLELEGEEYLQVSCVIFFQFTRAIVNLYKLTILEDPAWSQSMVRDTANVLEYLNRNEAIIRKCPEYITFDQSREMNILEKGLRIVQGMRMNWEPKLMEMWRPYMPANNGVDSGTIQSDAILSDVMPFGGIDEAWMMDFLGSL